MYRTRKKTLFLNFDLDLDATDLGLAQDTLRHDS